jgi:hypothetical protein
VGEVAGDGIAIWFVAITNEVGVVGIEIRRGNVENIPRADFVDPTVKLMLTRSTKGFPSVEVG